MQRSSPLKRKKPIRRRSKKRAAQERIYSVLKQQYLIANPICEVWLKEHGFEKREDGYGCPDRALKYSTGDLINTFGALEATEIHHKNKRHGPRLNDTSEWLAVCRENHERIENKKAWARQVGFLRNI